MDKMRLNSSAGYGPIAVGVMLAIVLQVKYPALADIAGWLGITFFLLLISNWLARSRRHPSRGAGPGKSLKPPGRPSLADWLKRRSK